MIIIGAVLLILGLVTGLGVLWTIGIILLVAGLVLWLLGAVGHAVGGRRHYW
ncbi:MULTISPECIES: DUF6131 family protein [Streptomyces]|uniref:DUF6131 family protein n=1 Tax=Streptomyces glycanivorans TaxID=3033808 RepID=A0ABY9J820_9ACTN|nr:MULTISPECIES: DUF6131 family protein [unclassified Streptomyces]WSQ75770.1 DUF6131 family protein [Streptomyces sp. NBC_01213]WLQ62262.1 DUF6131 family protein [Streptomyces sp. Alt3]WSQ83018.1 DUF6131 family protein [Streptomyces sp. NBC_01212]WSR10954.1 DUF6131 family protein [Streptomyces sp. NBC_01208]WSR46351.1 DUF6131 family protein [Streptomyces sp. NBC_01201]